MNPTLQEMFECLERHGGPYLPSRFWQALNEKNVAQLEKDGLENLKRTVAQNYFTWVVGVRNDQFRHLARQMAFADWKHVLRDLPRSAQDSGLSWLRYFQLTVFTRMLWRFMERHDGQRLCERVSEPRFGNPFRISMDGRLISQDLANSILEINAMLEGRPRQADERFTVCELGAGYGRNAQVFLDAFPRCRYVVIDIPPALYVSQEYLRRALPGRTLACFRADHDPASLRLALSQSDVVFLLPHQAELMADESVDLFINISSLHEMTPPQVEVYFSIIHRLTRGHFYLKQWKSFSNPRDGVTITERDYPYGRAWTRLYSRSALAQPAFFEAMYAIDARREG